jgi:hypothetical protein
MTPWRLTRVARACGPWLVAAVISLSTAGASAQTPPARRPAPTAQRPRPAPARPVARPAVPVRPVPPVVVRVPSFHPYQPPWYLQHLGLILGLGLPAFFVGLGIVGALVRKARAVPKLHRARARFAEFRQILQREGQQARGAMDARQQRALLAFSAQEYAAAASDLVSIRTTHRETLEKVEAEARQLSRQLDAVEATEAEREAGAIADEAERESQQLEEYGERLTDILRERLEALTAMQSAQVASGQASGGVCVPKMTISTMAAVADSRVHCRTCGAPLDPATGATACGYCGSPISPL